jgi:hypothetical protein
LHKIEDMKRKAHFQRMLAAQSSFEKFGRKSKPEQFVDEMNKVVQWTGLLALVEPYYPKAGNGQRPVGLAIMLGAYFVQQWFNLSDPGVEEALYESPALRRFVGAWIWVWRRLPTRPRSCASVTYSKATIWAARCWMRSTAILPTRASGSPLA